MSAKPFQKSVESAREKELAALRARVAELEEKYSVLKEAAYSMSMDDQGLNDRLLATKKVLEQRDTLLKQREALVGAVNTYLEHSAVSLELTPDRFLCCAECKSLSDEHAPGCKADSAARKLYALLAESGASWA